MKRKVLETAMIKGSGYTVTQEDLDRKMRELKGLKVKDEDIVEITKVVKDLREYYKVVYWLDTIFV